jgi:hypothetical protein
MQDPVDTLLLVEVKVEVELVVRVAVLLLEHTPILGMLGLEICQKSKG